VSEILLIVVVINTVILLFLNIRMIAVHFHKDGKVLLVMLMLKM